MDNPFNQLTDEQLFAFIRDAEKTEAEKQPQAASKARISLPDGSVLEAENEAELGKLVAARLQAAARPVERPEPPPQNAPARPSWDMKTFVDKFTNDPDEGLTYMETAKYGMPIRQAVPQMLQVIAAMAQKVNELETASFAPKDNNEREAVNEIIKARGWAPSRQAYEDALLLAKASGRIKTEEKPNGNVVEMPRNERGQFVSPGTFIPPRLPRTTGESNAEELPEDYIRAANTMPLDKLRDLLVQAGHFKA